MVILKKESIIKQIMMMLLSMAPPRVGQWMAMGQPGKANRSQL
jgi:hypothetical protein